MTVASNEFLTVSDVAHRLLRSADTVRRWERCGLLAAIRTPRGQRLFRREDVERLLADRQEAERSKGRSQK